MDIVYIKDLEIFTIIGIYDWERKTKQKVNINLEIATDIKEAALTENIEKTINYKAVSKRIISFVEASNFYLVETMAEEICQIVLNEFKAPWVRLNLAKPMAVSGAKDVGVIIERGQK